MSVFTQVFCNSVSVITDIICIVSFTEQNKIFKGRKIIFKPEICSAIKEAQKKITLQLFITQRKINQRRMYN